MDTNDVDLDIRNRKNNRNTILLIIAIILLLLLLGLACYIYFSNNNNKNKSTDKVKNKKNYEIKLDDESSGDGIEIYNLYVDNKKVDNLSSMVEMNILQYENLLLVEYFDPYDSNIVFVNSLGNTIYLKNSSKYDDIYKKYLGYRIEDDSVYVKYELLYSQGDIYYFCDLKSEDIIEYEQKYEYLGNSKFSDGTIVNEKKVSEHKFNLKCEDRNTSNKGKTYN